MFTARNSSCGKVMFSEAYVKNSFHGKGEEVSAQEGFLPGGSASRREVCLRGGLLWGGQTPPTTTGYGQQASGTHPTGMHSCYIMISGKCSIFYIYQNNG